MQQPKKSTKKQQQVAAAEMEEVKAETPAPITKSRSRTPPQKRQPLHAPTTTEASRKKGQA